MEISFKAKINPQRLTPQTLLLKAQQEKYFPKYSHDVKNDKMLCELKALANKYRQTFSIQDKINLLNCERNMLWEELEKPELTLARNYSAIKEMNLSKEEKKSLHRILTLFNTVGLKRLENLSKPFRTTYDDKKIEILERTIKKFEHDDDYDTLICSNIEDIYDSIISIMPEDEIDNSSKINFKKTKEEAFNILEKDLNQRDLFGDISINYSLDNDEKEKIKKLILRVLNGETQDDFIIRYATWAGGKYRNNEIFNKIKTIALNKNEEDIRKRELAIHSTALYLKTREKEVKDVMNQIMEENSIFSPLARILNDKIHGKYHGQIDREFNYNNISTSEKELFNSDKDKFLISDTKFNIKKQNDIVKNLLPFSNMLKVFSKYHQYMLITNDSYTKLFPKFIGKRGFNFGIKNSGNFYDSIDSVSTENISLTNLEMLGLAGQHNALAHETTHILHKFLSTKLDDEIYQLYKNAIENDFTIDNYSTLNVNEYFAQGVEAYLAIYKPHSNLFDDGTHGGSTRYKLLTWDPDLYYFIDNLFKKLKSIEI